MEVPEGGILQLGSRQSTCAPIRVRRLLKLRMLQKTPKGMILDQGLKSNLSNHFVAVVETANFPGGLAWPTVEECISQTSGGGGVMKRHSFGYNLTERIADIASINYYLSVLL